MGSSIAPVAAATRGGSFELGVGGGLRPAGVSTGTLASGKAARTGRGKDCKAPKPLLRGMPSGYLGKINPSWFRLLFRDGPSFPLTVDVAVVVAGLCRSLFRKDSFWLFLVLSCSFSSSSSEEDSMIMISGYTGDIFSKESKGEIKSDCRGKEADGEIESDCCGKKRQTGGHNNFVGTKVSLVAVSLELNSC